MCLGIPGQIISISDSVNSMAAVEISGVRRDVNIICIVEKGKVPNDYIGCWALVHVGFAMSLLDEEEAQHTLQLLEQLGELQELLP
jgi:hydrogenase expression/formation protein HypC